MDTTQPNEHDTDTLIWDYLDGEISAERCGRLSSLLTERADVRERFVESAVINSMLRDYYRKQAEGGGAGAQADEQVQPVRRCGRRRKHGRSPAA